jgi:hypothetical protein
MEYNPAFKKREILPFVIFFFFGETGV